MDGGSECQYFTADPKLVEVHTSWPADEQPELRKATLQGMQVLPDFVSEAEEAALLAELEPVLKRMRYEFDHWDNVSLLLINVFIPTITIFLLTAVVIVDLSAELKR